MLCLTAWRQPNIFPGNALFRPVNSQICRFKRYPMLSRTLPNRHGVSRTPIFGFGDRHATINTTRLYFFYKHFFKVSINSFTCFCVYTTGLPSSEDRMLIFPDFLLVCAANTRDFSRELLTKYPAGVESAPLVWKTRVISVRPRMHIYISTAIPAAATQTVDA